ncbi:hypothetical protein AMTR_s00051p00183810 [Amborella trichopoda]|uniref:Uncharacterized protein n=1 Tax=Amborella trichopoda TaxID=13333 RepID=U5D362_AMBTC|nr:hypothetical protein AMTR_s00051p00183810 [Amborella trichopoda]
MLAKWTLHGRKVDVWHTKQHAANRSQVCFMHGLLFFYFATCRLSLSLLPSSYRHACSPRDTPSLLITTCFLPLSSCTSSSITAWLFLYRRAPSSSIIACLLPLSPQVSSFIVACLLPLSLCTFFLYYRAPSSSISAPFFYYPRAPLPLSLCDSNFFRLKKFGSSHVPIKGWCAPASLSKLLEIYQLLYSKSQPSTGGVNFEA